MNRPVCAVGGLLEMAGGRAACEASIPGCTCGAAAGGACPHLRPPAPAPAPKTCLGCGAKQLHPDDDMPCGH